MNRKNKISIFGLWHLGSVITACSTIHFDVVAYDNSINVVSNLNIGIAPIYEPELNYRIQVDLALGTLKFTSDLKFACDYSDILWITYDTPIDENDNSDVKKIISDISDICNTKSTPATILISTQIPVGTCANLEKLFPHHTFVYIPENLRLGKAISSFENADRIIIGCRDKDIEQIRNLLSPFKIHLIFMKTESAEMVKHTINSFLALSITFINEIADVCEQVGADAHEVSIGVKSDNRIGKNAYLTPGEPFAGGTLARDVVTLNKISKNTPVISNIIKSNNNHIMWYMNKLNQIKNLNSVLFIGLTYTENTDTLRRSNAICLFNLIKSRYTSVKVYAYDSLVKSLPDECKEIQLVDTIDDLTVDAVIVFKKQESFKFLNYDKLYSNNKVLYFIDANKYLYEQINKLSNFKYINVGNSN